VAAVTPRLIVALDYATAERALTLASTLGDRCDFYKVGSELFTAAGPELVRTLIDGGADVFLDLKFHDIPNTMRGAARSAAALGARLVTVHASAGADGIRAAVEGAGPDCGVLAVSVLTSMDAAALGAVWGRATVDVSDEVLRLADIAVDAGVHGLVCSGREAAAVRARHGNALALLIPGIRPAGGSRDDQARVVTPRQAVEAGASYLVLGRPVTQAADPGASLEEIRREIAGQE
jgi:orotidine-5'-phosphate decarboxylase